MEINTEKCHVCSGKGYITGPVHTESFDNEKRVKKTFNYMLCLKCRGFGKVDWVSRVTDYQHYEIPLLKEATKEVRELIKKDDIFGGDSITILDRRRTMIKKIREREKKENENKY